jgi:hypothetical protein
MIFLYHNYAKNDEFNLLINNIMSDKDFTDNLEKCVRILTRDFVNKKMHAIKFMSKIIYEYGLKQFLTSEKIFPLREGTTHFKFKIKTFVFEMDVFLYPLENLKKPFKKYIQVTSITFGLEERY